MAPETTDAGVGYETAKLVAATPGATIDESRAEAGRTAEEKMEALSDLTEKVGAVDNNKTLLELFAEGGDSAIAAFDGILTICERSLNLDFVKQASLAEVLSGVAHQRGAMAAYRESPERVDDVVVPPGANNAGDEVLPLNVLEGSADAAKLGFGDNASADDAPAKSATREDWDAYAASIGLDPSAYSSKEELQDAVEDQQAANA